MKITDILSEGISKKLYHFTSMDNVEDIIEQNRIYGNEDSNVISVSRSINGSFHVNSGKSGVIFEIDGNKLSRKSTGYPVGGWREADEEEYSNMNYC